MASELSLPEHAPPSKPKKRLAVEDLTSLEDFAKNYKMKGEKVRAGLTSQGSMDAYQDKQRERSKSLASAPEEVSFNWATLPSHGRAPAVAD